MSGIFGNGMSWRTSLLGTFTLLIGAALVGVAIIMPMSVPLSVLIGGAGLGNITSGLTGIFSKDSKVTGVTGAVDTAYQSITPQTK